MHFDWDPRKAELNLRKHKVSFEEACSVFMDPKAIQFFDNEHSSDEDRFLLLGMSSTLRVLMICHAVLDEDETVRIISARKATKKERKYYPWG